MAEPSTAPSGATATTVRAGAGGIQSLRACSSVTSRGQVYVSPAATISRRNGQISGQSAGVAVRISTRRACHARRLTEQVTGSRRS
nr:hypothetical protein [Micromonospora provocatoris]